MRIGGRSRSVKVSLPASLAANWLLPRLHHFHDTHGGIHVELESNGEHSELESAGEHGELNDGEADLAIRLGNGSWPGLRSARACSISKAFRFAVLHSCRAITHAVSKISANCRCWESGDGRNYGRNGCTAPACRIRCASTKSSTICICSIAPRPAASASRSASTSWCSPISTTGNWSGRSIRNSD